MPHYLAYGSNLHPLRLIERVPSARVMGIVPMVGRSVKFHKRSNLDQSAKCNLVAALESQKSFGVLYRISAAHKPALDAIEGLGHGYNEVSGDFLLNGTSYRAFLYVAESSHVAPALRPFHWYKSLVLAGARYHGFPDGYVAALESVESEEDPDPQRSAIHDALLVRMARFSIPPWSSQGKSKDD